MSAGDPHGGRRVVLAGAPLTGAKCAVVMFHGRGGSPEDMVGMAGHLAVADVAFLAPEAAGQSWWPQSFLAPLSANEPGISSALGAVAAVAARLAGEGFGPERTVFLGFSQGACLALEFAARNAAPFAGLVALSGALVGTADEEGPPEDALYGHRPKRLNYPGRLDDVPVFLGCHQRDPHIPIARVRASSDALKGMGATVTTHIHPGAGHGITADEIAFVRSLLGAV